MENFECRGGCPKVLPTTYDDTLSYYELLCKVVDALNQTIDLVNTLEKEVEVLKNANQKTM